MSLDKAGGVRALTVRQPWAWAILRGKDVENRSWGTKYRGPVLIHGGKAAPNPLDVLRVATLTGTEPAEVTKQCVARGILAVAEVSAVCPPESCECGSHWAETEQFHWRLGAVRPLSRPIAARGALGLWAPRSEVLAEVAHQLGAAVRGSSEMPSR